MKPHAEHPGALMRLMRHIQRLRERRLHGHTRALELVDSISLGGRRQVALVRCGSDEFLVGLSGDGVTSIVRARNTERES